MDPERLFTLANYAATLGWIILIVAARTRWAAALVTGAILPMLFGVIYCGLLAVHFGGSPGGFSTLAGVSAFFANPWLLLAGWVHYLAFDLFIGSWEVRDAQTSRIPYLALLPCLILTMMLGPAGLLLYLTVRLVRTRSLRLDTVPEGLR